MQLILDEIHALQKDWESGNTGDWAEASIINSSKVLVVTVSQKRMRMRPHLMGSDWIGHKWGSGQHSGPASGPEPRDSGTGREYAVSISDQVYVISHMLTIQMPIQLQTHVSCRATFEEIHRQRFLSTSYR